MASEVPIGMGDSCSAGSSSFRDTSMVEIGESQALSWDNSTPVEAYCFLDMGARILEAGGGLTSPVDPLNDEAHQLTCRGAYQTHLELLEFFS